MLDKCMGIVYGSPGVGKSFEVCKMLPNSLHLASSPNVIRFYKQWLLTPEGQASGLTLPKREIVCDQYMVYDSWGMLHDAQGRPLRNDKGQPIPYTETDPKTGLFTPINTAQFLGYFLDTIILREAIPAALRARYAGEPPLYENVIIDELGTLYNRVFEAIPPVVTKKGVVDEFAPYKTMTTWSRDLIAKLRQCLMAGMNVFFVSHAQDYNPRTGAPGGPKFVSKAIMDEVCADTDVVMLRLLEEPKVEFALPPLSKPGAAPAESSAAFPSPEESAAAAGNISAPRRIWRLHSSPQYLTKIRGIPDSMFEKVKTMEGADILALAGFAP